VSEHYVGSVARDGAWLAVAYTADGFDHAAVFDGVGELWTRYEESANRIAIDVAIGLETASAPRPNERAARALLGERDDAVVTDVGPHTTVEPGDKLVIVGTDAGVRSFERSFT